MAVMRLKSNLKECSFGKTTVVTSEILDKQDNKHLIRKNTFNTLGYADINSDFSKLSYLSAKEKVDFKNSINTQLSEIAQAFARNAAKGIYGGRPVIKSNSNDDRKYGKCEGYIAGRKVGEFIGVIADSYQLSHVAIAGELKQDTRSPFSGVMEKPALLQSIIGPLFDEVLQYAVTKTCAPHDALSVEQITALYKVSQQLHYLIHKGFNWPVQELKTLVDNDIQHWVDTVKSSREGKIWGSTKKIPVILSEHTNE
jgi:hypothetical protein